MRQFKDSNDKQWDLVINVASAKKVRDLMKVDLYGLVDDGAKKLGELLGDPILFTEVVYHLCKQSQSMTAEEFCEGFNGDTLQASADAFFDELVDFFPDPKARVSLRKLKGKATTLADLIHEQTDEKLDSLNLASLVEILSVLPGNSPASVESTPALSPSAS